MASRLHTVLRGACSSLILAIAVMPGPARALDMIVGDVTIADLTSYGFTEFTSALTFDNGATDQLYEMFGYLGTASGTVRIDSTNFSEVSAITQVGNSAVSTLRLEDPAAAALGLTAGSILIDYSFTLIDDVSVADEDGIDWSVTLTNTTGVDIPLSLYTYLDLDLGGPADWADDLATIDLGRAVVTDADDPAALFVWNVTSSGLADHFALGAFPGVRTLLDGMGAAQDLPDTVNPFGPADFTAAYQFDRTVPAGSVAVAGSRAMAVPEPGTAVQTALGLVGLSLYGRRRKRPLL